MRQLRGWNVRCRVVITGRDHRDETMEPTFDLLGRLWSRRLRWAGHILRLKEASLLRRVLLAQVEEGLQGSRGKSSGAAHGCSTVQLSGRAAGASRGQEGQAGSSTRTAASSGEEEEEEEEWEEGRRAAGLRIRLERTLASSVLRVVVN